MSNSPPISIGTSFKIGSGSYKTVYACDITDADNEIFVLPENANVDKLCIAVVDIFKLVGKKFGKYEKLFFDYVKQSTQMKRGNKYKDAFEPQIKSQTDKIIDEINLQEEFFKIRLAPQIYEYKIDEGKMYILQEKCGISLNTYIDLYSEQLQGVSENDNGTYNYNGIILNNLPYIDENVFEKIVNLTVKLAENGFMNTDIKSANTCTKIAPNGLLIDIIALDFDPRFFIKIDLSNKELVDNAQIFMLTLFLAQLSKWRDIKFLQDIVEKYVNYEKIHNMVTFFANNRIICDKDKHPFFMLYHYIIGFGDVIETSCANNQTEEKINKITDKLCKCIFFEVKSGDAKGHRKTKRVKRTKRDKRSKRDKRTKRYRK
jgi:hypothetical protein